MPAEQNRYQAIVDTATDGIIVIDDHGIIQSFNNAARRLFGYETEEVIGHNVSTLMPPPDQARHDGYLANYRETGQAKIIGVGREVAGRRKDGRHFPLDLSIAQWVSNDGFRYFTGIVRDLTERKLLEAQRQADEDKYRAIVNSAFDAIVTIDESGTIQSINAAAEHLFGYRDHEVVGTNLRALMPVPFAGNEDQRSGADDSELGALIGTGRELRGHRKDGSDFLLELSFAEWRASDGRRFFTGIIRDVSDRKRAEDQARQAQEALQLLNQQLEERVRAAIAEREAAQATAAHAERMLALGQLAGGIAHDFNNVLQAITSAVGRLETRPESNETFSRALETISRAAARGSSVTERLLAFARRSTLKTEAIDITRALNDLARLLGQTLGAKVTVRLELEGRLPSLLADAGQLETALINLATNARDAMPDGGVLTFSAARDLVANGEARESFVPPGRYIRLTIRDTGLGMDEGTLRRATEPFFTTKAPGDGTGLGLSMAKGFAEQSGGGLAIRSMPGRGTIIDLWLPEADAGTEIATANEDANEAGRTHVLVVDDDELVLEALASELEVFGFAVSRAASAKEATGVFERRGADVLLTDLAMPHTDGITLVETLQAQQPDLPAILITGFSADRLERNHTARFRMLRKPVTGERLRCAIMASLAEAGHPLQSPV